EFAAARRRDLGVAQPLLQHRNGCRVFSLRAVVERLEGFDVDPPAGRILDIAPIELAELGAVGLTIALRLSERCRRHDRKSNENAFHGTLSKSGRPTRHGPADADLADDDMLRNRSSQTTPTRTLPSHAWRQRRSVGIVTEAKLVASRSGFDGLVLVALMQALQSGRSTGYFRIFRIFRYPLLWRSPQVDAPGLPPNSDSYASFATAFCCERVAARRANGGEKRIPTRAHGRCCFTGRIRPAISWTDVLLGIGSDDG